MGVISRLRLRQRAFPSSTIVRSLSTFNRGVFFVDASEGNRKSNYSFAKYLSGHVQARLAHDYGKGKPLLMPALSPTMTTGKLVQWAKKENDKLMTGDILAHIETDKATVDFEFQDDDYYLAKILVPEGTDNLTVGTPLAVLVEDLDDVSSVMEALAKQSTGASSAAPPAPTPNSPPSPSPVAPTSTAAGPKRDILFMPSARALLAANNIDPSALVQRGTGKHGMVTKGDVLVYLGKLQPADLAPPSPTTYFADKLAVAATSTAPAAPSAPSATATATATAPMTGAAPRGTYNRSGRTYQDVAPSTTRKVIASRLTESKATNPHQYYIVECKLDDVLALRKSFKQMGVSLSVNDIVIKAVSKALRDVPEVNCYFNKQTNSISANNSVDISVAVATEGGLITPIVKDADKLGVAAISEKVKELANRAKQNKLKPAEFQGGSFTISNLGMFGIDKFSAVINPPQCGILAVGAGQVRPIAVKDDNVMFGTVMAVQLSADARVVEPQIAGQFLQAFKHYMENPTSLLI